MSTLTSHAIKSLSVAACLAAFSLPAAAQNVLFAVDFSGSMNRQLDGRPMISIAKEVFRNSLGEMPAQAKVGLMLYGHRRAKDCRDIELVARIGQYPASSLAGAIDTLPARGETPIATALMQAADAFSTFKGQQNSLVLITDGKEECNGDPCSAASALVQAGLDVKVHVVGFRLTPEQRRDISCINSLTGGRYFDAQDSSGLKNALTTVRQVVVERPTVPVVVQPRVERMNLLSQKNGGEVLISAHPAWAGINDDKVGNLYWFKAGEEVVFGFKDGSAANFDTFGLYLPKEAGANPKEIELFAGDDSATGTFRSLGIVTPVNARVRDGWQEFKMPATTAKYFKVKLLSSQGASMELYEMRLSGELTKTVQSSDSVTSVSTSSSARTNLLSQANGGEVLISAHPAWAGINDDKVGNLYWFKAGEEVVFGFKDGRPATFDSFGIYLPKEVGANPKAIELFVADDSMTGRYRSLGVINPFNGRVRDGWQLFDIPSTTAKYFKVKLLSSQGSSMELYEMRLFGEVR